MAGVSGHQTRSRTIIAKDVMTSDPITLTRQATIKADADLMWNRDIRPVPMVDERDALE